MKKYNLMGIVIENRSDFAPLVQEILTAFGYIIKMRIGLHEGTEEEWSRVNINNEYNANKVLKNATKYFYSENEPTTEGNYWRYVDGVATKW